MDHVVPSTSAARRAKLMIGGAVIVIAVLGLIGWAMGRPGSTSFYMTVDELRAAGATSSGEDPLRVNGNVVAGSLRRDGVRSSFAIADAGSELRVTTSQPLPDAFATAYANDPTAVEVVAEGRYDGSAFVAASVFAKCPSKFKAKA